MKIGDIIAKIGELITAVETSDDRNLGATPDPRLQNPAGLVPIVINTGSTTDANTTPSPNGETPSGNDKAPENTFLPPLQQKQELLKKAVGVENVYDDGGPEHQHADEKDQELEELKTKQQDIVDRIKQLSGIPVAAVQELSNDDIFDD